jgi:hypothetical protein
MDMTLLKKSNCEKIIEFLNFISKDNNHLKLITFNSLV